MAAKSILDIEVNDEQFKRFVELFGGYKEALQTLPDEWKGAEAATVAASIPMEGMTAALLAQVALIKEMIDAEKAAAEAQRKIDQEESARLKAISDQRKAEHDQEKKAEHDKEEKAKDRRKSQKEFMDRSVAYWKDTANLTADVARNTINIGKGIADFAIKGIGFGLLGAGAGLFGLDALANVVGTQRRDAQGLGVPTSMSQAFEVNFGRRLVGPDFLSGIQNAQTDITRNWQFGQLGINDAQNMDPATLGIDVIQAANKLWRDNPQGHNQQFMAAHGLSGLMSYQDWQRIGQQSPAELQQYEKQYGADQKSMGENDPTQKAWQDFALQLDRAGKQIQAVFVDDLTPLVGPLGDLSKSLVDVAHGLLTNPHMKEWIDDLSKGLESLAKYLGSDAFDRDLKTFVSDIAWAAQKLGNLFGITGNSGIPSADPTQLNNDGTVPPGTQIKQRWDSNAPGLPGAVITPHGYDFSKPAKFYGLPASLFSNTAQIESSTNPHPKDSVVNGIHYQGMFQMGPVMQAQYGVSDPYNADQETNAFGREMDDYLSLYGGDTAKALAAHNWGPGNLKKDIAQHGDNWLSYAPTETQNYIKRELAAGVPSTIHPDLQPGGPSSGDSASPPKAMYSGPHSINVSVTNQTGAQIAIVANGVRQ